METKTAFIVKAASAKMPNSCWGQYGRVAVLEVRCDAEGRPLAPKIITERSKRVVRIVRTWERQHMGATPRCAFDRALRAAYDLAADLNEGAQ